jgi:hypothetical protein
VIPSACVEIFQYIVMICTTSALAANAAMVAVMIFGA